MGNDYANLSNSELKILMNKLEDEYEASKIKISSIISRMEELDKEFIKVKEIYAKRTRGMKI